MTANQDVATRVLDLSEAELFQRDRAALDAREQRLLDEELHGLALQGPARVSCAERGELPLVLGIRSTGLRAWEVPRDTSTCLVGIDLDTREVRFGAVFRDPKLEERPLLGVPRRGSRPSAPSIVAGVHRIDARSVLALPWRPARYRFAVVSYDWVSNLVDVELTGEPPAAPRPSGRPAPRPAVGLLATGEPILPTYRRLRALELGGEVPALRVFITPGTSGLVAHGAFAVRCEPELVPPTLERVVDGEADETVSAVVPLTLAAFDLASPTPASLEVAVPVYGPALASPGEVLHGQLALPLPPRWSHFLDEDGGSVYAVLEGRLFGPL